MGIIDNCGKQYAKLIGGFNPSENYYSTWIISSSRAEHEQCVKPPPRKDLGVVSVRAIYIRLAEIAVMDVFLWKMEVKLYEVISPPFP